MVDFIGATLSIGDSVILIAPQYRMFVVGKVLAFTPKNIRVAFINTWNFGLPGYYTEILQASSQLVRIDSGELASQLNIAPKENK